MKIDFKSIIKKFVSIFTNLLIVCIFLVIIMNLILIFHKQDKARVPSIFGYKFLIELSDSMNDAIKKGDLIVIKEKGKESLNVSDIIAYRTEDGTIITHRIVSVSYKDGQSLYLTQGDDNPSTDLEEITPAQVEGVYCFRLKGIGNVFLFLSTGTGIAVLFLIIVTLFLVNFLIRKIMEETAPEVKGGE